MPDRKKRAAAVPWSTAEREMIRDLIADHPIADITRRLNAEFSTRRSVDAVIVYTRRCGLYRSPRAIRDPYWSRKRVTQFFRCFSSSIELVHQQGLLLCEFQPPGTSGVRNKRWGQYRVRESAIERFIRDYPWAYDPKRLAEPDHRLTKLAHLIHQRNTYWSIDQCARWMGTTDGVMRGWIKRGVVPTKRRLFGAKGGRAPDGQIVVPTSALHEMRDEILRRRYAARIAVIHDMNARRYAKRAAEQAA